MQALFGFPVSNDIFTMLLAILENIVLAITLSLSHASSFSVIFDTSARPQQLAKRRLTSVLDLPGLRRQLDLALEDGNAAEAERARAQIVKLEEELGMFHWMRAEW